MLCQLAQGTCSDHIEIIETSYIIYFIVEILEFMYGWNSGTKGECTKGTAFFGSLVKWFQFLSVMCLI